MRLLSLVLAVLFHWETAMSQPSSEPAQEPRAVVRAFISAMEKMDFATALQVVDEEVTYINSPATTVTGHAGIRQVLEPFFAPIEENEFVVLREVVDDATQTVVLERLDRHRLPQGWLELPVTGIFEVRDGKISYWREYFDVATLRGGLSQLLQSQQ